MQADRLDIAENCLQLSSSLSPSLQADTLLSEIRAIKASRIQVARKQATVKKEQKQQKVKLKQENKSRVLLEETQQALARKDLQVARATFLQIPASELQNEEVAAVQDDLEKAVSAHVKKLILAGDAQYRSDNVLGAVRTWTEGLSLDPDNTELRDRVERANRVLARLDVLRRQQGGK
jgi:predicted HNH restriction endonuclease